MNNIQLALIVEGHGETEAFPVLIRRIASEINPQVDIKINTPVRISASKLRSQETKELKRSIELASLPLSGQGHIFILLDCDWDNACPKTDGPKLLSRARAACPKSIGISVILANQEFESWFIAGADSLKGKHEFKPPQGPLRVPESIRGAKEWMTKHMPRNTPYVETLHQAKFAGSLDIGAARQRSDSLDKCWREIEKIVKAQNQRP